MSTIKIMAEEVETDGGKGLVFFCPGCKYYHSFRIKHGDDTNKPVWNWNGDMEKPTFSPSLLVNGMTDQRCHSFVNNGQIQYLDDCWHELRGKTIDIPEIEW